MSWTKIEEVTLSSSAASVTLGNGGTIPQGYKTLKLLISARTDRASQTVDIIALRPNGSTANGTYRTLSGNGTNAVSGSGSDLNRTGGISTAATATSNTFGNSEITIPNYSGSTNKPWSADGVSENNATEAWQEMEAVLWSNSAAITSFTIASGTSNNFVSGSTFTLYGLK